MSYYLSKNTKDTERFAAEFAKQLKPGDVVAYLGGMGVGKTAFTRGLAAGLSVSGEVSSPTFALVHEYPGKIPVYHFDMYRITSFEDLYSTGFFDYLDSNAILVIEWSEHISDALPEHSIYVEIKRPDGSDENLREILISRK